ncbi:MAG: DinB family protein [Balneolaceae bacterium]|nr:DinB family protein [Balneolaceae bacterium]
MSRVSERIEDRQKLQRLFQFDLWCTRKLNRIIQSGQIYDQEPACYAFLSHIVHVQQKWYDRVTGNDSEPVYQWEDIHPADLNAKARKVHGKWIDLIGDHDADLDSTIYWINEKGVEYAGSLRQICNHLIVHGQHHRAQISLLMEQCGEEPPSIDYNHYASAYSALMGQ